MDLAAVVEIEGETIGVFGIPKLWQEGVPPSRDAGAAVCAYDKCNGVCGGDYNADGGHRLCRDRTGGANQCCAQDVERSNNLCTDPSRFVVQDFFVGQDDSFPPLRVAYITGSCKREALDEKYRNVQYWQNLQH